MKWRIDLAAVAIVACHAIPGQVANAASPVVPACGRGVIRHAEDLCFPAAKMSVEAWIRPEAPTPGRWMRILSKYGHTAEGREVLSLRGWELSIKDTRELMFRAVPARDDCAAPWVSITSKTKLSVREWTHVACVLDGPGGWLRLYINAALDAERKVRVPRLQVNPKQDLYIGVYGGYDQHFFRGLIDEVRLTAEALRFDAAPTKPYRGKGSSTVALYHFEHQLPNGVIQDAAAAGRHPLRLLDGDLPALAPSKPGFGMALRLTGVAAPGLPFKPQPARALPHPTVKEIGELGQAWQKRHPQRVRAEVLGAVSNNLPVHGLTITDFTVPDEDKEVVLMVAAHVGGEISGGTALLAFAQWLVRDDPLAAKIRSRQICVLVPVANPYGYGRSAGNKWNRDPAWCWSPQGATFPDENPEGVLLQKLMDRLQPDVCVDSHGTALVGQHMGEFVGTSGYSLALNTFQGALVREMARAAGALGFPQHLAAESHEKILLSEPVPGAEHAFFVYQGGNAISAVLYPYIRYHTIPLTMESGGWAGSAVARLERLMAMGCDRWPTEPYPGYPNRRISSPTAWMQWLAAYGQTAAARRRSRVELWQKQKQMVRFASYPDTDGAFLYGVATVPAAGRALFRSPLRQGKRISVGRFLLNLSAVAGVDAQAIRRHLEETGGRSLRQDPLPADSVVGERIRHGLALRSLIPYRAAKIVEVRMNGRPIGPSPVDGYQTWCGNGGTHLQVNVPPAKVGAMHIVTCRYDGQEERPWGFAWRGEFQ